jgi:hypothetical protein
MVITGRALGSFTARYLLHTSPCTTGSSTAYCPLLCLSNRRRSSPDGSKIVLKFFLQVSGVVETEVWTADKQPVALLAKKMIG